RLYHMSFGKGHGNTLRVEFGIAQANELSMVVSEIGLRAHPFRADGVFCPEHYDRLHRLDALLQHVAIGVPVRAWDRGELIFQRGPDNTVGHPDRRVAARTIGVEPHTRSQLDQLFEAQLRHGFECPQDAIADNAEIEIRIWSLYKDVERARVIVGAD